MVLGTLSSPPVPPDTSGESGRHSSLLTRAFKLACLGGHAAWPTADGVGGHIYASLTPGRRQISVYFPQAIPYQFENNGIYTPGSLARVLLKGGKKTTC